MFKIIIFSLVVLTIIILFTIPAYADSYNLRGESHEYDVFLSFSDNMVTGIITLDNTIYLNNIPVIEKNNKLYIIDNQNNIKILAKHLGTDKYLIILKSDDSRYRFLAVSDRVEEDTVKIIKDEYQNNLESDIVQLSINAQSYANNELTAESILAEWEKSKEITGMKLVVKEVKPTQFEKPQYIPELLIVSSHDFRTYWQDTFNIDVQTYDGKINPKATGFEGRLDNANVTVTISYEDTYITLSGVTANNGHWDGEHYFPANISMPGEYTVDVMVSYLNQTVTYSDSMFVINYSIFDSSSSNSTNSTVT